MNNFALKDIPELFFLAVCLRMIWSTVNVIDGEFLVIQQHNYQHYDFILEPGVHTLYAESIKGEYQLKEKFTIRNELWASIDFQYSKGDETLPQLRLKISETQLGFL